MAEREQPVVAPRPLFDTLSSAIHAAIAHGTSLDDLNCDRWGETYHCTPEQVRETWIRETTRIAPCSVPDIGEGK